MANLTATFEANFSKFYDAVDGAVVKLRTFEDGAARVGPRLSSMVDQFSGRKVIEQAELMTRAVAEIGGVGNLTEKELAQVGNTAAEAVAKMRALGIEVPKNLQSIADATKDANKAGVDWMGTLKTIAGTAGIVFSAQAVLGFVSKVFETAGAIHDMALEWGVSTEAVQKYTQAAKLAGASGEDVGKSINFMSKALGEGTDQYKAFVEEAGLSFSTLRSQSPEQTFRDMVSAIESIPDPLKQSELAVKLFGKSAQTLLPAIRDGFLEVADAQKVMSDETINRLEKAGDAWQSLWDRVTIITGEFIGDTMQKVSIMTASWGNFFSGMKTLVMGGSDGFKNWIHMQAEAAETADQMAAAVKFAAKEHTAFVGPVRDAAQILADKKTAEDRAKKSTEEHAKAIEETKKAQEKYNESMRGIVDTLSGGGAIDKANQWMIALKSTVPVQEMTRAAQDQINKILADGLDAYKALGVEAPAAMYEIANATQKAIPASNNLLAVLKDLPAAVDVALPKLQTSMRKGMIGALAPGGTGIDSSGMFAGLGKGIAGAASASILRALEGGGDVLKSAGASIGTMLLDPKQSGIGKAITEGASKLPGIIGGALGTVLPVVGSLLGPAIEFATKGFGKLFGRDEESKTVNPMRDKFVEMAGGIGALNQQAFEAGVTLDAMLKADKVETYNAAIDGLKSAFEDQQSALATLDETAKRYGFTIEELGPAMQRQQLDKQAQQLFKDWTVLNAAGIDTIKITEHMSDSVNDYIHQAMGMGSEVPEAMRPMLEAMVKAGTLTDENGVKIDNLEESGISFALTMSEGFKALITSVDKLATVLSRTLGVALDDTKKKVEAVPRHVDVEVEYREKNAPSSAEGPELEGLSEGTKGRYRDWGKGTPVILHGWEAVVPKEGGSGAAMPIEGGGEGGGTTVIIHAEGSFFDTPGSLQMLANKVNDALTAKYGMSNRMRVA